MKNISLIILSVFLLVETAFADSANIALLRSQGLSSEQAREIDAIYSAGSSKGDSWFTTVPVASPTPGLATNQLAPGRNIVAGTPTSGWAVFVGPTTPIAGQRFIVENPTGATIRLKAAGAALMNHAGSAGGWVDLLTLRRATCETISATSQTCVMAAAYATPQ